MEKGWCTDQLKLLPFALLYQNGDLDIIEETDDLAEAMERQVDNNCNNAQILQLLNQNKLLVLYVSIAQIFPMDQNITGLNWEYFNDSIDRNAVINTRDHLKAIATNTKNIADNSAVAKNSATSLVEHLDYRQLPKDVQAVYLRKNEGQRIIQNDIKKFKNELTEDSKGMLQSLKFVEFPKSRWTYIIYTDGTFFRYLGHQQKDLIQCF